ncbi:phosphate/phosphite/phosphonate ABC transporter substrate-binding protein [Fluviispira multicolorata]|uniref:Phosphate/phosphite/phosphonate ABC transporter substrate-binding protein n=1 Tax=Fluviispira multicolorata TaxID=2654512 RepID=A0A833JB01_9BACT|nr:phosphate/phosphite/phosphonate ABC transporter substrate-binding protein [Fluviispira multicolorata]KAB8028523.1 phosphate/phosphite/phosphonate ABC transporter substrate-binding protein [Fluviispira multicolorata]
MGLMRTCLFLTSILFPTLVHAEAPLGSRNNPLKIAIIPQAQASKAIDNAKPVIKCIEQKTKLFIQVEVPNSYIAVTEALGSKQVDVAFSNILGYFLMEQNYGAEALFKVARFGTTDYQSFLIVKSDSKIKSISDLNGKSFAYGDAGSLTGYILPKLEMKRNKVNFAQELPTGSMDASIMALMQGKADAAAAFFNDPDPKTGKIRDARERLLTIYPDIVKKTNIIWKSELIPNEPVVIRKGIPKEIKEKLIKSMPSCMREHALLINDIDDLLPIEESDNSYKDLIETLKKSDLDVAKVLGNSNKK